MHFLRNFLSVCCCFQVLFVPDGARATGSSDAAIVQELRGEIAQLRQATQLRDTVIQNLIGRIENLEVQLKTGPQAAPVVGNATTSSSALPEAKSDESFQQDMEARLIKESEENYKLIQAAFEQRLGREGGMLLAPYQVVYEPSISYAHTSYENVVIDGFSIFPVLVVGDIVSEKVQRDILTNTHSLRIGLPWDMQLDVAVPVGYERVRSFRADDSKDSRDTSGMGDISVALSHQLFKSHSFMPDTLISVNYKSDTGEDPYRLVSTDEIALGTGFETWGASATFVTNADPCVLFGGVSSSYTLEAEKDIGLVQPGMSIGFNMGTALAVNVDTSLSLSYQYLYTTETQVENRTISGTDLTTSTFGVGFTRTINDLYSVDIDLGIGLTEDTPNYQLTVSVPFRYSFFN